MMKEISRIILFLAVVFVPGIAHAADAAAILTAMADRLAGAKVFSVTMLIRYDSAQASGQLIEFSERRELVVQRPAKMRVDVRQSDGDAGGLILDGKQVTQFDLTEGVYAQLEQSGDLDATVRYAVEKLDIRFPLARLLVSNLESELRGQIERVAFVETDRLGDEPLDHVAAVALGVDAQFWIRPDKLPARIVLTYRNAPGQPRFSADFLHWNLAPEVGAETFTFKVSGGAEKIPVLVRTVPAGQEVTK